MCPQLLSSHLLAAPGRNSPSHASSPASLAKLSGSLWIMKTRHRLLAIASLRRVPNINRREQSPAAATDLFANQAASPHAITNTFVGFSRLREDRDCRAVAVKFIIERRQNRRDRIDQTFGDHPVAASQRDRKRNAGRIMEDEETQIDFVWVVSVAARLCSSSTAAASEC
jgi:hypothetical protein